MERSADTSRLPVEGRSPTVGGHSVVDVLRETLAYCRDREYRGWDYCDGLSSGILHRIPVENKWLNLMFQETVKRAPINLRRLFLVEQRRNYKGTALFALANLDAHRYETETGRMIDDVDFEAEANGLTDWLVRNRSLGFHGFCGGHKHRIQNLDGQGHPNDPDMVSTSYAVKALLAASHLDDSYVRIAETSADFVVEDLDYREIDGGAKINYHLNHPDTYYTLNAGALGGRTFADLYAATGEETYLERATAILDYIATKQTERGGWYYREPQAESHLSMDNHHNAFIVESFLRHRTASGTDRYDDTIERGLSFFSRELVAPNGAPNFDESNRFPRDIHAAANSILLFVYAGEPELAGRVLEWTLEHMYAGDGRFYYRKGRYFTKRFTLMRWAQAWMAFAVAEYLAAVTVDSVHEDRIGTAGEFRTTALRNGTHPS
jgi:hypothetical protein